MAKMKGPIKKGEVRNPTGRPRGAQNKATSDFKEALNRLLEHSAENMLDWMEKIAKEDPKEAMKIMTNLAEFAYPKLSRTSVESTKDINITVNTGIDYGTNTKQLEDIQDSDRLGYGSIEVEMLDEREKAEADNDGV